MIQKNKLFSYFLRYSCNIRMQQWLLGNLYMLFTNRKSLFDHQCKSPCQTRVTSENSSHADAVEAKSGFKKRQEWREQEEKVEKFPKLDTVASPWTGSMSASARLSRHTTVSWRAAGLFATQIGENKCFVKGFGCIWAEVPLFKRLLSFQSQVAVGHLF